MKRTRKLILALVVVMSLLMAMAVAIIPASAATTTESYTRIWLSPNSNWTQANARFAAYFFGNGETWVDMTKSGSDYYVDVPAGYTNVIFCRMNPSTTANNWNNKWNQTGDLKVPTDSKIKFTVPSGAWDGSTSGWGTYHSTHSYSSTTVDATCTKSGSITETCNCGYKKVTTIDPAGHSFNDGATCTICGEPNPDYCAHESVTEVNTTTCTTNGQKYSVCDSCHKTVGEVENVDAYGHEFNENYVCTRCNCTRVFYAGSYTTLNVYTWNAAGNHYAAWPGTKVTTKDSNGVYYFDIPAGYVNVIFNNGSAQSSDLKVPTDGKTKYTGSAWGCYEHIGGEATCSVKAKCTRCQTSYGEVDTTKHGDHITHVEERVSNCHLSGNDEYWFCTACSGVWLDEELTQSSTLDDVNNEATTGLTHVAAKAATCTENGNIEHWYCETCGYAWLDAACTLNTNLLAVVLPAGHKMADATCTLPSTCSVCGHTDGEALGHALTVGPCANGCGIVRVYYTGSLTNVHAYVWNNDSDIVKAWPGTKVETKNEYGVLYFDVPANYANIIFNNGKGGTGNQTADLKVPADANAVYNGSAWVEHIWADATCIAPKTCKVCGETQGEALGHSATCGHAVACVGGVYYATFEEALDKGGEITLTGNTTLSTPLVLNTGVAIDLKGYTLTANGFVAFGGTITDSTNANGRLVVPTGKLEASSCQGTHPVLVSSDETTETFAFRSSLNYMAKDPVEVEGGVSVIFRPSLAGNDKNFNGTLFADGAADNKVIFTLVITRTPVAGGESESVELDISDAMFAQVYSNTKNAFQLTLTGANSNYSYSVELVVTTYGVEMYRGSVVTLAALPVQEPTTPSDEEEN